MSIKTLITNSFQPWYCSLNLFLNFLQYQFTSPCNNSAVCTALGFTTNVTFLLLGRENLYNSGSFAHTAPQYGDCPMYHTCLFGEGLAVHIEVRGQLSGIVLCFHPLHLRDQTRQVSSPLNSLLPVHVQHSYKHIENMIRQWHCIGFTIQVYYLENEGEKILFLFFVSQCPPYCFPLALNISSISGKVYLLSSNSFNFFLI